MTENTKEPKKRKSRRSRVKHPNLNRKYNIKARRDYIESEYVDGVYDSHGNQVIRPLNEEEKNWLDQFYKETVNANLKNAELYTEKNEHKQIYSENNARNRCLYNQAKKTGKLLRIDPAEYDERSLRMLKDIDFEQVMIEHIEPAKKKKKD